jgi:hypothetical protein
MTLFVEGVGGTGKAVINLLSFSCHLAEQLGERTPDFSFSVTDQDDQGVWPGVPVWQAAPGVTGQFKDVIRIVQPTELSAARLLFSQEELETETSRGFHGHPKLLAGLRSQSGKSQESQLPNHVVVYSDIGGTGAGLGPLRLRQLVETAGKRNVIGIVFGKYINQGAVNPTGFQWLRDEARLPEHAQDRSFTAYYLTVPMFQVPTGAPPQSGLNPTPSLLLAVEYLWNLGLADEDGLAQILFLNNRAVSRESVKTADFEAPLFSLSGSGSFISKLRNAARINNLANLLDRSKEYLHLSLVRYIASDTLTRECWNVYAAEEPRGATVTPSEDLTSAFKETFASVPDVWAAARWFHIAAARNVATCRDSLLKLIVLYLKGYLNVVPTNWSPDGGDRIYALCTEPLRPNDPDFLTKFQNSVVGGFSERYPFWTVPDCEARLSALDCRAVLSQVNLVVARNSQCAGVYLPGDATTLEIGGVPGISGKLPVIVADGLQPSRWDWILEMKASNWEELIRLVSSFPLIGSNISVKSGGSAFEAFGGEHSSSLAGVRRANPILSSDGIYAGEARGLEFYELVRIDRRSDGRQSVQRGRRLVIEDGEGNLSAKTVDAPQVDLDILVGNVLMRLNLS